MRVRWEQIDPRIAAKVGVQVALLTNTTAEEQRDERVASTSGTGTAAISAVAVRSSTQATEPEPLGFSWSVYALAVALLVVFLYTSVCFNLTGPALTFFLTLLPVGIVVSSLIPAFALRADGASAARARRPRGLLTPDALLRGAFARAAGTRAERLYGEIIMLLASDTMLRRDVRLRREMLNECNTLLSDHFRLETQRKRVRRLLAEGKTVTEVETEHAALSLRAAAEMDPIARRSLDESVELCEERLESVRALTPLLSRLDAHDEVVCQALSLAQATLTRAEAAALALTPPDVSGLRQTVRRVNSQTRAVEEAVAEITGL
jgi:hypothetical protein